MLYRYSCLDSVMFTAYIVNCYKMKKSNGDEIVPDLYCIQHLYCADLV